MKNRPVVFICTAVFFLEAIVRASGLTNFPLYDANNNVGYIPSPSQSGSFLWKNDWMFNSLSMGAREFSPSPDLGDVLLVGDSVVLGGNPYRSEDRLGPRLSDVLGLPVWPVSAGSWAFLNELSYIGIHPEVRGGVDKYVFVLNSGDFGPASFWQCEKTHPRSYPISSLVYVFKKYVYDWNPCPEAILDSRPIDSDWRTEFEGFLKSEGVLGKPVVIVLYPHKWEFLDRRALTRDLEYRANDLAAMGLGRVSVISVGRDPRWSESYYKDEIHPTVEGTKVLAEIVGAPSEVARLH